MKRTDLLNRTSALTLAGALASMMLASCNPASTTGSSAPAASAQQAPPPIAALALTDASAAPSASAPDLALLPAAPRAHVARLAQPSDSYAYADRAAAMNAGFGHAPPDYTYDDGGVRPWIWQADNGAERFVEPVRGGNRYYYYQPGSDLPFLVRDPQYSYGFEGGQLVVIYDRSGRALSPDAIDQYADDAGRLLERGRRLHEGARQARHEAVAAAHWRDRQRALADEQAQWDDQENQDEGWRAYHDAHYDSQASQWDDERYRREAESARFAETIGDAAAAALLWQSATAAQHHDHSYNRGGPAGGGQGGFAGQGGGQPQLGGGGPQGGGFPRTGSAGVAGVATGPQPAAQPQGPKYTPQQQAYFKAVAEARKKQGQPAKP